LRGSITTIRFTTFCSGTSKVGSSAKEKNKERKDLTGAPEVQSAIQEMTSLTKRRLTTASETKSDQKRKSKREKAEASRDIFLQSLPAAVIFPGQDGNS
jgi:hypothetical protein